MASTSAADDGRSALIFLGTGTSGSIPNVTCLIQASDPPCAVCSQALSLPPEKNPNYRCNSSLLIDYCQSNGNHSYIVIDVGKTFREQLLRWFTLYKIPRVDSIILTHEHADAVLGLDDVRSVQPHSPTNDVDPTPIYLTQFTMESVAMKFPYLVPKKVKGGQQERRVAQLDWRIIDDNCDKPFVASGLQFFPLPVMHGKNYICLGFLFGEKNRVASFLMFHTSLQALNMKGFPPKKGAHHTHFCLPETLEAVKRIRPKRVLIIGLSHDFDYHKDNELLIEWSRREGILVQLAHDGLRIPIEL
ncbi:hypothetical protein TIFTF001_023657 [Ficus carica]|uniref:Metallo-beta-lactamase domain-containing protein n=1 Tax=Ficus carica TaxID=3494 RepID=A0AA88AV31_FICCA|nr:hypothetical protein TIFTF001_023657 [Ficus carica]